MVAIPLTPSLWKTRWGNWPSGQKSYPTMRDNPDGDGWDFVAPQDGGGVGTIIYEFPSATNILVHTNLRVEGWSSVQAGGQWYPVNDPHPELTPAKTRVTIQRWGDNETTEGKFEHYRLYSNAPYEYLLGNSSFGFTVPLDPKYFNSTQGKNGEYSLEVRQAFLDTMRNVHRIGFVYGGGYYAHWVRTLRTRGRMGCTVFDLRGSR